MKILRYITYLFYSYYSKGSRRNVAYLSSILGVTFLTYIHILIVALLLRIENYIPIGMGESRGARYIKLMLLMSPIFFLFYFGIKEKYLEDIKERMAYRYDREYNHRILLFIFIFYCINNLSNSTEIIVAV